MSQTKSPNIADAACTPPGWAPCTIEQAALELGKTAAQVRRMVEHGAPVVNRGGRGRGRATLLDPAALAVWEQGRESGAVDLVLRLANDVPKIVEDAVDEGFVLCEGARKKELVGPLIAIWYLVTTALLDRCRVDAPTTPEIRTLPHKIARLKAILDNSCKVQQSPPEDIA